MTTGNEPQLGGQDRDDSAQGDLSPMISGRGTKIIVSARGAYQAGNLRALIELMDEAQKQRYQRTITEPKIRICEHTLPQLTHYRENALCALDAAKLWMNNPTTAHGWRLLIELLN